MAKTSTVVVYTLTAVLLLFFLTSHTPRRHSPRRLKLRPPTPTPSSTHAPIPFDPIISTLEQRREDREWEREHFHLPPAAPAAEAQPEWEDFYDAEDYINDEDRFNVTHRIQLLFPQIDVSPADGAITADELTDWNLQTAAREVMHRSERDMELHDKDHDGFVSFAEYEPPVWARRLDDTNSPDDKWGWWREEHFNAADADGDGLLNKTEFNDFLHPADTVNPKLIHWLCKEEIRERDKDKDGKLSFQEYFQGLFDSIRNYDEDQNQTDSDTPAKKLFAQLDVDNDGFLTVDEIKPVIGNLHPSERFYAKQQAEYVLQQVGQSIEQLTIAQKEEDSYCDLCSQGDIIIVASSGGRLSDRANENWESGKIVKRPGRKSADTNSDGRLSLEEMIEHPYVFYSSIFNDEDDDEYHDEFR